MSDIWEEFWRYYVEEEEAKSTDEEIQDDHGAKHHEGAEKHCA